MGLVSAPTLTMSVNSLILGRSTRRGVRLAGTGLPALCAVVGLSAFDRLLIASLLIPIAHAFRVSLGTATLAATVYLIATGLAQVSHGQLSDRIGRAGALRVALIALAVGNATAAAAPTLAVLIAGRTVAGAASGGLVPGALVLLADRGHDQRRARHQAVLIAALGFGTALAALPGLADHGWAWRIPLGISAAAAIALIAAIRPSGPVSVPAVSRAGWRLLANPQVRVLALVAVPEGAAVFGFIVYYAPALTSAGRSPAISALGVAGVGIGMLLGGLVARRLTGQITDRRLIAIGASILTVGYLVATDITLPTILAASVLTGIGQSGIHSCLQRWATEAAPEARGVSTALFAAGAFSGAGLAALLGVVIAGHYTLLFIFAAASAASAGGLASRPRTAPQRR